VPAVRYVHQSATIRSVQSADTCCRLCPEIQNQPRRKKGCTEMLVQARRCGGKRCQHQYVAYENRPSVAQKERTVPSRRHMRA